MDSSIKSVTFWETIIIVSEAATYLLLPILIISIMLFVDGPNEYVYITNVFQIYAVDSLLLIPLYVVLEIGKCLSKEEKKHIQNLLLSQLEKNLRIQYIFQQPIFMMEKFILAKFLTIRYSSRILEIIQMKRYHGKNLNLYKNHIRLMVYLVIILLLYTEQY